MPKSATKTGICLRGHEYLRRLSVYFPDFLWRRSKIPDRGSDNRNTCEASRRIKIGPHWSCSGHHCALSECSWWLHKTIHCGNLEAYYFLGLQPEVPCIFIWANSAIWIDPTFTSSSSRQDVDCGLWIVRRAYLIIVPHSSSRQPAAGGNHCNPHGSGAYWIFVKVLSSSMPLFQLKTLI